VNFKHFVAPDELGNGFVNRVVQFNELLSFVVLLFEDGFLVSVGFQVLFHVEKQLKQQFADSQVFANVLLHFERVDVFEIGLFGAAVFQELLDLLDLLGDLHHSKVSDFLLCLERTPL
jgi:hypothetical protein